MLQRVTGAQEAAKSCGDSLCLIAAVCLRVLVKGITKVRRTAFALCELHGCLISSEVVAALGIDRFL